MSDTIYVLSGNFYRRIAFQDIKLIKAESRYSRIVTDTVDYLPEIGIGELQERLPVDQFCRVHRSYVVSLNRISYFNWELIYLQGGMEVPIGDCYRSGFKNRVALL